MPTLLGLSPTQTDRNKKDRKNKTKHILRIWRSLQFYCYHRRGSVLGAKEEQDPLDCCQGKVQRSASMMLSPLKLEVTRVFYNNTTSTSGTPLPLPAKTSQGTHCTIFKKKSSTLSPTALQSITRNDGKSERESLFSQTSLHVHCLPGLEPDCRHHV